jgi:aminoglycoside phosphotransferase (APT) family kinase protein
MGSRDEIYYWKCDCEISEEDKKRLYLSSKYDDTTMLANAADAVTEFFGAKPDSLRPFGGDGNHYAYISEYKGKSIFLRTDDGLTDDDYMMAESALMDLARQAGVPVPEVWKVDTSMKDYPFRYQVMELVEYPALKEWDRQGKLNEKSIADKYGLLLSSLHGVSLPGYGFIDTAKLTKSGSVEGIDTSLRNYFDKCLGSHLDYVEKSTVVDVSKVDRIKTVLERGIGMLDGVEGKLVHRDFAYWNLLGTADDVLAVIDWDDAVSGDPADDFGILGCFHERGFIDVVMKSYSKFHHIDEAFKTRSYLHQLRNMLWKTVIRHRLGYFDQDRDFFLNKNALGMSIREYTVYKIDEALLYLEKVL